jgi:hypothetical protein
MPAEGSAATRRSGWPGTGRTVAAILANPRYTGRQVWNRQCSDQDPAGGRLEIRQRHPAQDWVISEKVAHAPLVSEEDFVATQAIRALRPTGEGTTRTYLLAGVLRCGLCRRRMDSHWVNNRPGYRCRHGHTSAKPPTTGQRRNLYLREDTILTDLSTKLSHITQEQDPHSRAEYLRVNEITIVCGYDRCSLSSENATTAR